MAAFNPRQLNPPRYRNEDEIGLGTLISLTGGTGIAVTPDPIVETGVIALESLAVDPSGTYGDATNVSQITVDAQGRVTAAADVPIVSGIVVQEEGVALATNATTLNFTGTGVTASGVGATKTINVAAGVVVMDDGTVTGDRFPTDPSVEGCWYGTNTKGACALTAVVIGNGAVGSGGLQAVAVGDVANAGVASVAIGSSASATGNIAVAIGRQAVASGGWSVAVGPVATSSAGGVSVGRNTEAPAIYNVAVGYTAKATGTNSVCVGGSNSHGATGNNSCAIGALTYADATSAVALGYAADCNGIASSIAIGASAFVKNASFPVSITTNASGINATAPTGAVTYLGITVNGVDYKLLLQVP